MRGGDPLNQHCRRAKRERILTRDEEVRLLNACDDRWRKHSDNSDLPLDTGMRRGEICHSNESDVDFRRTLANNSRLQHQEP